MYLEVDKIPAPSKNFFISVGLSKKEAISFDNTLKGCRVIKQVLAELGESQKSAESEKADLEWDVVVIDEGKFSHEYHVRWTDKGKQDQINGETWETAWEKPLDDVVKAKLLAFSHWIARNYKELDKHQEEYSDFEQYLNKLVSRYRVEQ